MPVPTGPLVQEMSLVIPRVMWTPCDRVNVRGGTSPLFHPPRHLSRCPLLNQVDRFRVGGKNRAWKARETLHTGRARFPLLLGRHFLAVTRSAILSYSVFGMMRRVTTSPGSL
jgi:hypothetical protein